MVFPACAAVLCPWLMRHGCVGDRATANELLSEKGERRSPSAKYRHIL